MRGGGLGGRGGRRREEGVGDEIGVAGCDGRGVVIVESRRMSLLPFIAMINEKVEMYEKLVLGVDRQR